MRLFLPLIFYGINTILCGISSTEVDNEFHSGSDIFIEPPDFSSINTDKSDRSIEQEYETQDFSKLQTDKQITLTAHKNLSNSSTETNKRWPTLDKIKLDSKIDSNPLAKNNTNSLRKNRTHKKVKVRRKKIKYHENLKENSKSDKFIETDNTELNENRLLSKVNRKKSKKLHTTKKSFHIAKNFSKIQNNNDDNDDDEFPIQITNKKRKSYHYYHQKSKKRSKSLFLNNNELSDFTTLSPNDKEGFVSSSYTNSLNSDYPSDQQSFVEQQQQQPSSPPPENQQKRDFKLHKEKQRFKNKNDGGSDNYSSSSDKVKNKNENKNKRKNNTTKNDKIQRLAAREERRKFLQAKRAFKRKQKLKQRTENVQRKGKKNEKNINAGVESTTIKEIINNNHHHHHIKENFVASPSIDYFIEKPSNYYFDTNDTPTLDIIGVSIENPSIKNLSSIENEFSQSDISQKVQMPISILSVNHEKDEIINNKINGKKQNYSDISEMNDDIDNIGNENYNNNNNNNNYASQKAIVTLTNGRIEIYSDKNNKNDYDDDKNDDFNSENENRFNKENIHENGGDLSCLRDDFQPAPQISHADIKYLRNEEFGSSKAFLEIEYICHHGYRIHFNDSKKIHKNIYCKNGRWIGTPPICIRANNNNLTVSNKSTCNFPEKCEQLCFVNNDVEKCTCRRGFRMKNNRCEDINECAENISGCEFGCVNTIGSYQCKCPKGLRLGDGNSCIDVNECLLRNGHGPCQDICINIWGSYKCSCDNLPGTQLSADGHSCSDIDECTINNGGCSHTCLNTMGRAFCLCPEGWTLDSDWKTCVDIDECAEDKIDNGQQRCEFGCINTPGSYSCLIDFGADQPIEEEEEEAIITECLKGYFYNWTTKSCEDINECARNNGDCHEHCVNTVGSYHCTCRPGYVFDVDGYNCILNNGSSNISCPALFPPKHGYLECSRPISIDLHQTDFTNNGIEGHHHLITNRPGSQCVLRCPTGFQINGKFSKYCNNNGEWVGDGDGTCIRYPEPKLICPKDIVLEPPQNQTMAKLKIPRPKTDVNYERDVSVYPDWFHNSEVALEVGVRNVTYTARHPISKLTVSCSFKVTVLEGEPPIVKFCPPTQTYNLNKQHESIKIAWNEPIFTDNVNVTEISRTNNPGNSFGVGSHQIVYTAKDEAGHETKCTFKILVNVPYKPVINHPLPIYHMFYKKRK